MRTRLVTAALAAALSLAATSGFAQTQPPQTNPPALSDEKGKAQQNSADEAAPKGTLEAGKEAGDHDAKAAESNKKLEEAAEKAKQKTGGSAATTGTAKPQ
jgi:predicted secreted protein